MTTLQTIDTHNDETTQQLMDVWTNLTDIPARPIVRADIAEWLDQGLEAALIRLAIRQTAEAPEPAWRYTCAIINRCIREGVTTVANYKVKQKMRRLQYGKY